MLRFGYEAPPPPPPFICGSCVLPQSQSLHLHPPYRPLDLPKSALAALKKIPFGVRGPTGGQGIMIQK